ncbi:MFS transporter [Mammaliicoccus sciuri]|uniref:MFS transporter n=1 Tax=Mammaliicoccus sciuri TaxID=1296 RepID=UPI001E548FDC|nr:MFS transporter [Mammaliicoccus sciuri]MCD8895302.1 MFS transporter [Mammaliicoccus sciuri]MCD8913473.1 MFS transporter [Mammaliicoccus sciuri]
MKFNKWFSLILVSSALFLIVIDMTVLYTALPTITYELEATAFQKLWIVNAYPLVVAGLLPGLGTLGDKVGHKNMFLSGLVIFTLASVVAAFSPTSGTLIMARVILAIGAATMMPSTLAIIKQVFDDKKDRALALGIWSSIASAGAGLGPLIGGLLLTKFWWGSVFLINVPITILVIIVAFIQIPNIKGNKDKKWDITSSILIMIGLIGTVYAIKEVTKENPSIVLIILTLVIGLWSLKLFINRQKRLLNPLISLDIFKNKYFLSGVIAAFTSASILIGFEMILSQRLQLILNLTPLKAGLVLMSMAAAAFIGAIVQGSILTRFDSIKILIYNLIISLIGIVGFTAFLHNDLWIQILFLSIAGLGLGGAMTVASNAIMTNVDDDKAGMAASVEEVSYELGGSIGIAALGGVFSFTYTYLMERSMSIAEIPAKAKGSFEETMIVAENSNGLLKSKLLELGTNAFDHAYSLILIITITIIAAIILLLWRILAETGKKIT